MQDAAESSQGGSVSQHPDVDKIKEESLELNEEPPFEVEEGPLIDEMNNDAIDADILDFEVEDWSLSQTWETSQQMQQQESQKEDNEVCRVTYRLSQILNQ